MMRVRAKHNFFCKKSILMLRSSVIVTGAFVGQFQPQCKNIKLQIKYQSNIGILKIMILIQ